MRAVREDEPVIGPSELLLLVLGYGALALKLWALVDVRPAVRGMRPGGPWG